MQHCVYCDGLPIFWVQGVIGGGQTRSCSCASLFCSCWLAWPIGLAILDAVGETCLLTFPCYSWAYAVLLSEEKRAVCNVLYRFLDQLIQTACLKLLWKICYSIPLLSSTNASAIGSLSFIYLKFLRVALYYCQPWESTRKNCRRKTVVTTNFFVARWERPASAQVKPPDLFE